MTFIFQKLNDIYRERNNKQFTPNQKLGTWTREDDFAYLLDSKKIDS